MLSFNGVFTDQFIFRTVFCANFERAVNSATNSLPPSSLFKRGSVYCRGYFCIIRVTSLSHKKRIDETNSLCHKILISVWITSLCERFMEKFHARPRRAPLQRKCGNLSIRENLVRTSPYARRVVRSL